MKTYIVTYTGNSSRFKGLAQPVKAKSPRLATEHIYSLYLDGQYFPQDDESILDAQGNLVASPTDDKMEFDGGYFVAQEI